MIAFTRETPAGRIVFGPDRIGHIEEEASRLTAKRILLIASGSAAAAADRASALLGARVAGRWAEVRSHVTAELAQRARAECAVLEADLLISVGGGAATGLAKAVALRLGIPILAIPTTYAGSEVTAVWGLTEGSRKTTGKSADVRPKTVIYDPLLTVGLPAAVSVSSGLNAIAHCVEALYASGANPVSTLLALEGIRRMAAGLTGVVAAPAAAGPRADALYAAYLGGSVMAEAGTGLHHKICHVLGGMYGLPHADLHAAVLPHAVAFIESAEPAVLAPVAAALGGGGSGSGPGSAARSLFDLAQRLGAPTSLAALGVTREQILAAAPQVLAGSAGNSPAPAIGDIVALLENARTGQRPT